MGRKIVLTGTTLTDTSAPKLLTIDPIESAGSLYLVEPMHPSQQWDAGIPAGSTTEVPNIMADFSSEATGVSASSLHPIFNIYGGGNDGVKCMLERTAKGGVHGIVSQSTMLTNTDGAAIVPPAALITWIAANKSHIYYISTWARLTRSSIPIAGGQRPLDYAIGGSTHQDYSLVIFGFGGGTNPASPIYGSRLLSATVGPTFANSAKGFAPTNTSGLSGSTTPGWGPVHPGTYNGQTISNLNGKWASHIVYRVYMEDLTVSGRTYAEVDEIDYALYTKEVLTPGGRYYGDTFTDPATIP